MGLGWGSVLGKVFTFIPGRVERMKNERDMLLREKTQLLQGAADDKKVARMARIVDRLRELDRMLLNKIQD